MKRRVHAAMAMLSLVFISTFWVSTVVAELFLGPAGIAGVKQGIAYALLGFVPAMALTAGSGFALGGKGRHPLLLAKRRRMPYIAANGLLVLAPALATWRLHPWSRSSPVIRSLAVLPLRARAGLLDPVFYGVQALELVAGAANLALIGLNVRDGLRLRQRAPGH